MRMNETIFVKKIIEHLFDKISKPQSKGFETALCRKAVPSQRVGGLRMNFKRFRF